MHFRSIWIWMRINLRTEIRMWDKFTDNYFESTRTGMRTRDKFKNQNNSVGQV